jgi:YesN/AraC family two-component response regulator
MDEAYAISQGNTLLTYLLDCTSQGKYSDIKMAFSNPNYPMLASHTIGDNYHFAHTVFEFILPQVVRAAINGGVSWKSTNDIYFDLLEKAKLADSIQVLMKLYEQMFLAFAESVASANNIEKLSPVVQQCRSYIDGNIFEPLYVYKIASALHISSSYLSHIYKKESGESISDYIKRKKISEAKWLLKHTAFSISDIYAKLSYCSQSYFTNIFHEETGMTPRNYRASAQAN